MEADFEVYNSSHAVKEDILAQYESYKALYVHACFVLNKQTIKHELFVGQN